MSTAGVIAVAVTVANARPPETPGTFAEFPFHGPPLVRIHAALPPTSTAKSTISPGLYGVPEPPVVPCPFPSIVTPQLVRSPPRKAPGAVGDVAEAMPTEL